MKTLKQHLNAVKRGMNANIAATKTREILDATNECACAIAGQFPIGELKDTITVVPGDRLPSNLAGIIAVRDASDNSIIYRRGEAAVGSDEEFDRYHIEMERSPFSSIAIPFKSTGSILAGSTDLSCSGIYSLLEGSVRFRRQIGDTVFQASIDANGDYVYDADGKLVLVPIQSSEFDPQLSGVRFYVSAISNNEETVYYGENGDLAYWSHETHGWIITALDDVGGDPDDYFDMENDLGTGMGSWAPLFISAGDIEDSTSGDADEDDIVGTLVCIANEAYGDYYYKITGINDDESFSLDGTHPHSEEESTVTIFRERNKIIRFIDQGEAVISSGKYTVYYWTIPNPLTQDEDIIPFEYPSYLELLTLRSLPASKDRRPVSKRELDDSRGIAKKKEPVEAPPSRPMTAQGTPFSFNAASSSAYSVRGE